MGTVTPTPILCGPAFIPVLSKAQKRNFRKRRSQAARQQAIELKNSSALHWQNFDENYASWSKRDHELTSSQQTLKKLHFEQFLVHVGSVGVDGSVSALRIFEVFQHHYKGQPLLFTNALLLEIVPSQDLTQGMINWDLFPNAPFTRVSSDSESLLPQMRTKTNSPVPSRFSEDFDPTSFGPLSNLLLTPEVPHLMSQHDIEEWDSLTPQSGHMDEAYHCAQTAYDKLTLLGLNVTALFAGVISCPNPHFLVGILTTYIVTLAIYYYLLGSKDRSPLSPQAGYLDSDDGAAFSGKPNNSKFPRNKEPKKAKPKPKPPPGVAYVPPHGSASFGGPKKPKKDSTINNGPLNGFGVGI